MANIQINPGELSSGVAKTITLNTKDTYVLEDIDVIVKPQAGSFNNAPTTGVTYTENTADNTILPEKGYLYLNKGWFDDTKISLGHLIPEIASNDAGVSHILSGYKAYDEAGNLITGTMATVDPKFDGGGLTVTPTVTGLTAPTVTVSSSGTFKTATAYGVTTKKPTTGTDGTNYLTIDGSGTLATSGSVKAKGDVTRAAVLYNGATTGYIDKADNTVALKSDNASQTSTAETIGATITDNFAPLYIPIVSVSGTGGVMEKASSGNSATLSGTNPVISLTYGGKFTDTTGTTYGVTTTAPTGTDGTDFLSVSVGGEDKIETFTGSTTIKINRAAVTNNGLKQGAINIADGATLLAGTSDTFTHDDTFDITASLDNKKSYYIPIIKSMPVKGGTLSQGTSSVTVSGTNPTVTIKKSGAFTDVASGGVGTTYGVTTIAPTTGTDGTNFLKITIDGSSNTQTFTGSSTIYVSRADVKHNGAAAGAIKWTDGSSILAAIDNQKFTATNNSAKSVTADVNGGETYYIPIVSLEDKGIGGAVKASATASISSTTNPSMDFNTSGSIITDGLAAFGISHSEPVGTGEEFYSLIIEPSITAGSISGTISGTWNRTAVKSNGAYKGAVSLTTETQFLAEGSGTFDGTSFSKTGISVDTSAITSEDKNWYFKKAVFDCSGGALEDATLNITGAVPTVTPDIIFYNRTNSTTGSTISYSQYGITTTAPTTGNWVEFRPLGTSSVATFTGTVTAARSEVNASVGAGLTKGDTATLNRATKTYTNTRKFEALINNGTYGYIHVVAPVADVSSHSVTNPTVNCSEETRYFINGTAQTSTPLSGILVQASNPSDFGKASYIKIAPSYTTTNGSSIASASAKMEAGITTGGENISSNSTQSVGVTKGTSEYCFIKVYDGTYSVK